MICRWDSYGGMNREEWYGQNKDLVEQSSWKGGEGRTEFVRDVVVLENAETKNLYKSHLYLLMDNYCKWHAE